LPPPARAHRASLLAALLCGALACAPGAGAQAPAPEAGATLTADPGALVGRVTRFRGALPEVAPGGPVRIERLDPARGWVAEATTAAGAGGTFVARWRPRVVGRFTVRAVAAAVAAGDPVRAAAAAPTAPVTVFRPVVATWYGPGLYGHHTACGQVLSHRLLGVAHRTLRCGTPVELAFDGRTVTVPVVDRGPFTGGARYDLTSATAQLLGVTQTATIGVAPQRGATAPPAAGPPPPFAGTGGTPPVAGLSALAPRAATAAAAARARPARGA
jgi:rare lipoprotein A